MERENGRRPSAGFSDSKAALRRRKGEDMNKWLKGILIAALVMIAAGGMLAIGGRMLGGQESMDGLLQVSAAEQEESGIAFDSSHEILSGDFTQELDALPESGTGRLTLEVGNVSVNVQESDGKTAGIEGKDVYRAQAYVEDGTLYIKADSEVKWVKWMFGGGRRSTETVGELTLYLPKGFSFETANLTMGSGALNVDELNAEHLYCNVGMGSLDIMKLTARDAEVYLGMGEINLYDASVSDMVADIGMGSMYMNGSIAENLSGVCGMGSMTMELAGKEEDYNYDVSASMGSIRIGDRDYSGMSSQWDADYEAAGTFDLDVSMGSIEISFS